MEYSYQIMFSFQESEDDSSWKFGQTEVTTDRPIDSVEALREVGRSIGLTNNYVKVVVNSTIPPMENIDEILARKTTNAFGQVVDGGPNESK